MAGGGGAAAVACRSTSDRGQGSSPGDGPRLLGYVFGAANRDITVFDATSLRVIETKPLGATVRWLGNELHFWDGRLIWTFDHPMPANIVELLAVDPRTLTVARTISTGGRGPAHAVELTADRATAWVNIAGDDALAVVNLDAGEVVARVPTGRFP